MTKQVFSCKSLSTVTSHYQVGLKIDKLVLNIYRSRVLDLSLLMVKMFTLGL